MAYDNNNNYSEERRNNETVFSKRIKAGKRRTYFFDVRETKSKDYFITLTESKKRFNDDGYDRHKIFLYKEDFNKFLAGLTETIDFVKTDLMPDFDFDAFNHDEDEFHSGEYPLEQTNSTTDSITETQASDAIVPNSDNDTNVDSWKM